MTALPGVVPVLMALQHLFPRHFYKRLFGKACSCSKVVKYSTTHPKIKGSNAAATF
jgi:hypothetical protein